MSQIEVDKIIPQSGTALQVGENGDTITVPAGATLDASNATTTLPSTVVTTTGTQTLTNKSIVATQLTGTITPSDNTVTLAKMAPGTDGNIISYDASGNPVAVATGSAGQVLTSAGAGAPPTFAAVAAGGKVLQVLSAVQSTEQSTSSTSYVSCNTSVNITPSASSSKILVTVAGTGRQNNASDTTFFTIFRDSTNLEATSDKGFSQTGALSGTRVLTGISINFLDSPSSSSQITYALHMRSNSGGNARSSVAGSITTITVMEIAG